MKLQAKSRLLASGVDPKVSKATEEFLTMAQKHLKSAGFEVKKRKQSALYDWEFEKDGRRIVLNGWHGTGGFGAGKTLFDIFDTEPTAGHKADKYDRIVHIEPDASTEEMLKAVHDGTAYIQSVKK